MSIFQLKKRVWVTRWHDLVLNSRGDSILTCDLVLPKHPVRNLRQYLQEKSEVIAYELEILGFS